MATNKPSNAAAPAAPAEKKRRNAICAKHYLTAAGEAPQKIVADSEAVEFRFTNNEVRQCNIADYPENILNLFTLYGIAQKLGDAYAGVDGDVDAAVEQFDALNEQLQGGDWASESRASGPRIAYVVEGWERVLIAAGKPPTAESKGNLTAILKAGGTWPDGSTVTAAEGKAKLLAVPAIAAAIAEAAAERAAERLKKLQDAAAATTADAVTDLDF